MATSSEEKTAGHAPQPKRSLPRRLLRWAARGLVALLGLVLLLLLALHTGPVKERLRQRVEARLGQRVNGTVTLARLDYLLFFGDVQLGGLVIADEAGAAAIELGGLRLAPAWGELLRGHVTLDALEIEKLSVHLVKDADGGSNLKRLFKPRDPIDPPDRLIELRRLSIVDVAVDVKQPDGTRIAVEDLDLEASIALQPKEKTGLVKVESFHLDLGVDKGAGGLKLGLTDLRTALRLELDRGAAKVHLDPLHGDVSLTLPGKTEQRFPIDLKGLDVSLDEGEIAAAIAGFEVSAVALASLEAHVKRDEAGLLRGEQAGDLVGLHLDRARLHALLGREILANDVDAEIHVKGPAEKVGLGLIVRSGDARVSLDGTAGPGADPTYDLKLAIENVETAKLLAPAMSNVPPAVVRHLELTVKGRGAAFPGVEAEAKLRGEDITVRGIVIAKLEVDARVERDVIVVPAVRVLTLGQELRGRGRFVPATKEAEVHLELAGDVSEALDGLRAAGRPVATRLPRGAVVIRPEGLTIDAKGPIDGDLAVNVRTPGLVALGGTVRLDAHAVVRREPEGSEKKVSVKDLGAILDVRGVRVARILALRGRDLPVDAAIGAHVEIAGPIEQPQARFSVDLSDARVRGLALTDLHVGLRGRASKQRAVVDLSATGRERAQLLTGHVEVPLTEVEGKPRPATNAPFSLKLDLAERSLRDLVLSATGAPLLANGLPDAKARLAVDLHGTLARPQGKVELDAEGRAFTDVLSRLAVRANVKTGEDRRPTVGLTADAWLDASQARTVRAAVEVSVARSPVMPGPREPRWSSRVELGPIDLAKLPDLSPRVPKERIDRLRALGGIVSGDVQLFGDDADVRGKVDLAVRGLGGPGRPVAAPIDLVAHVAIEDRSTRVDVDVDAAGSRLLEVNGQLGLAGKALLAEVRAGRRPDPDLDLDVDVPSRPLASLRIFRPALDGAPGTLAGHLDVSGTASAPMVHGAIGVGGIASATGGQLGVGLLVDVDRDEVAAAASIGPNGEVGHGPFVLRASVPRAALKTLDEASAPLDVSLLASGVPVASLVPALASTDKGVKPAGELEADLKLHAELRRVDGAVKLLEPTLSGSIDLKDATFVIPGAKRAFRNVALGLRAEKGALHLERLHAEETDLEKAKRTLDVSGRVGLEGLRPTAAKVQIGAQDWLLFGKSLGRADAPRGTLTLDAHVDADLSTPIRKVSLDVRKLAVLIPDRFDRAHQPEDVHVGDVVFVEPGVTEGKLPVPESVKAAASPPPPVVDDGSGTDIAITIRPGARVLSSPIDLVPEGALTVAIRPTGRVVRGRLDMKGGELSLGGKMHPLTKGSLVFDDAHPKGEVDLWFAKPIERHQLRDVSKASGGEAIRIHMMGPIDDRKTVISGAGSPGALFDLLAMHNAGHPRFVTEPDLPDTGSVEFQSLDKILILSFLSVNLPHLLFLDRAAAWSDPYDDVRTYGRLDHYEAERTDGRVRLRGTGRPEGVGRSEAELGLDYLFVDRPTFQVGTGVTAGSRLGGGPGVFLEWSSED